MLETSRAIKCQSGGMCQSRLGKHGQRMALEVWTLWSASVGQHPKTRLRQDISAVREPRVGAPRARSSRLPDAPSRRSSRFSSLFQAARPRSSLDHESRPGRHFARARRRPSTAPKTLKMAIPESEPPRLRGAPIEHPPASAVSASVAVFDDAAEGVEPLRAGSALRMH